MTIYTVQSPKRSPSQGIRWETYGLREKHSLNEQYSSRPDIRLGPSGITIVKKLKRRRLDMFQTPKRLVTQSKLVLTPLDARVGLILIDNKIENPTRTSKSSHDKPSRGRGPIIRRSQQLFLDMLETHSFLGSRSFDPRPERVMDRVETNPQSHRCTLLPGLLLRSQINRGTNNSPGSHFPHALTFSAPSGLWRSKPVPLTGDLSAYGPSPYRRPP